MKKDIKTLLPMIVIHISVALFALCCIVPFVMVVAASFSNEERLLSEGVGLLPRGISLNAYKYVFKFFDQVLQAYGVSIFVTVVGTVLNMAFMLPFAYAISKPTFRYRRILTFFMFFTVMFSGGLVPSYMLIKQYLNMYDSIWVLIIPLLVQPSNIILLRVFFQSVPSSLFESAKIDGASEYRQLWNIGMPLIIPGIATVTFFSVLMFWNDSYTAIIYIEDTRLIPIQIFLTQMSQYVDYIKKNLGLAGGLLNANDIPSESILYAMCVVAAGPMIVLFSFFQKYFVRGLTAGSVKE
ncbi:MAG: carbohydrate ABC transporter permease [Clostridia bacterium]|nr:carbohydrate ABC transporter permease [Clostridia bacterium]